MKPDRFFYEAPGQPTDWRRREERGALIVVVLTLGSGLVLWVALCGWALSL